MQRGYLNSANSAMRIFYGQQQEQQQRIPYNPVPSITPNIGKDDDDN